MPHRIEFLAERAAYHRGIRLYARIPHSGTFGDAPEQVLEPLKFRAMTDEDLNLVSVPAATISNDSAQQLMDELWRCGLRPTEGTGSAGSLAATERHLADMRTLVFNKDFNKDPKP